MRNNIIVYGANKEQAYTKLQQLLNNMKYGDVATVKKDNTEFVVILKNGDIYKAITATNNARGHKWHYAYISTTIDKYLIDAVILPAFISKSDESTQVDSVVWYTI